MNLRTIYGDAVADQVLSLPLERDTEFDAVRLIVCAPETVYECCVIGAANLIAMEIAGRDFDAPVGTPSHWKAKDDAKDALQRPLTPDEEDYLLTAIEEWDSYEWSFAVTGEMIKFWCLPEGATQ